MRTLLMCAAACAALSSAAPASAAIRLLAQDYDLTAAPLSVGLDAANQIVFSYDSRFNFDVDPTLVQTTGSGAVTAFGGFLGIPLQPSTFFTRANVTVNASIFPGFAQFPDATRIPGSIVASDLGLRVTIGGQDFFGYARFVGPNITVAFNDIAGAGITAGTVPEPASWAMLILGFGAIGGAVRTRRSAQLRPA
jgi:hypothetical protein